MVFVVPLVACGLEASAIEGQVVFRDSAGRELTLDEVTAATGQVNFELVGAQNVPEEAARLHQAGRRAGSAGQTEEALALFAEAASLAPDWPYPLYDAAFSYLLLGDFGQALDHYRRTVALAPRGFFTALTAVGALELEHAGVLPVGIYLRYVQLEWIEDLEVREASVRELISMAPGFAPAWKELAVLTTEDGERLNAIERGLEANPDAETRGILLVNRAIILFNRGDRDEAISILGTLALDPASSLGSSEQAKAVLALVLRQEP